MQISRIDNNINFGKKLQAKATVLGRSGSPVPCKIFEIEPQKDKNYFAKVSRTADWDNGEFVDFLDEDLRYATKDMSLSLYSLETEDGQCIGIAEVSDNGKEKYQLDILETAPVYTNDGRHQTPEYRYIGETMLSFLTKLAIKNGKKAIRTEPADTAYEFYTDKCFFKKTKNDDPEHVRLKKEAFKKLLTQNSKHTKTEIELIG